MIILDRVCDIYRLTRDTNNTNKEVFASYLPLQAIAINVQPASPEETLMAGVVFGQAYTGFTTASGILKGDKLIVRTTGEVLRVKGKENWMSPDMEPHIELLLIKFETEE